MHNSLINFFKVLSAHYKSYYSHSKNQLKYVGIVGAIGFPLFFLIYTNILIQPYESLTIRIIATGLCLGLALKEYWPKKIQRYYLGFSYFSLLYCLPFFHAFMSLKNHGNVVFIPDSLLALFFLVLLTDWRNTVAMILLGGASGTLLYFLSTDNPTIPMDYVARLPTFILIAVGGSLFKFSTKQIEIETAYIAMAGSIAHEMRNPMREMKFALDKIAQIIPVTNTGQRDHIFKSEAIENIYSNLEHALASSNRGLQIIDMTLRQVSNQELDPSTFTYLSASAATRKAIEEYGFESQAERDRLALHVSKDFTFKGDETAFIYIIFNLLKNSLYYFKSHLYARIVITIERHKIIVSATGPGIPEQVRKTLFRTSITAGKFNGTALGLSYCHRTMLALGGTIECQSTIGQFTSFCLNFPAVSLADIEAHTRKVMDEAVAVFHNKRILVVDDQDVYHNLLSQMLADLGCQVDGAESGNAAIEFLQLCQYDLIIMDLRMPGKDGYATTEEIRSGVVPKYRNIAIVAHSSEDPATARIKTLLAGMNGFLSKPCTKSELINEIVSAMRVAAHRSFQEQSKNTLKDKTILITDDELFNHDYVETLTEALGMKTLHATSGTAAVNMLAGELRIDFILMDMRMPMLSGTETAKLIRKNPAWQDVFIVAVTGNSGDEAIEETRAAGMNGFITKPVNKITLQETLIKLLMAHSQGKTRSYVNTQMEYLMSNSQTSSNRFVPASASQREFFQELALIDFERMTDSKNNLTTRYAEFMRSMIVNLDNRNIEVHAGVEDGDINVVMEALHSMKGLAGYLGAHALMQYVKLRLYPAAYARRFPEDVEWATTLDALIAESVEALEEDLLKEVEKIC